MAWPSPRQGSGLHRAGLPSGISWGSPVCRCMSMMGIGSWAKSVLGEVPPNHRTQLKIKAQMENVLLGSMMFVLKIAALWPIRYKKILFGL